MNKYSIIAFVWEKAILNPFSLFITIKIPTLSKQPLVGNLDGFVLAKRLRAMIFVLFGEINAIVNVLSIHERMTFCEVRAFYIRT